MTMHRLVWLLTLVLGWSIASAQQPDTRPHASNLRFNTLRAGSLTNCTTGSFVTGWQTTGAPVCSTINLGMLTDSASVVTLTGVQKVFNKQHVPREVPCPVTAAGVPAHVEAMDVCIVPALSAGLTINAPVATGTNPEPSQELLFRFAPTAAPQALTWNPIYTQENGVPLPTNTIGDNATWMYVKVVRNSISARYGAVATTAGITRGLTTLASSTTYSCNSDIAKACEMQMTSATAGQTITIALPGGVPTNGRELLLRVMCTQAAQNITLTGTAFVGSPNVPITGLTCPFDATRWVMIGSIWSSVLNRWQVYATN